MTNPASIICELREERIRQGKTQWALAKLTGYHEQEISRWENGRHDPRLSVVVNLADALGLRFKLETAEDAKSASDSVG